MANNNVKMDIVVKNYLVKDSTMIVLNPGESSRKYIQYGFL